MLTSDIRINMLFGAIVAIKERINLRVVTRQIANKALFVGEPSNRMSVSISCRQKERKDLLCENNGMHLKYERKVENEFTLNYNYYKLIRHTKNELITVIL